MAVNLQQARGLAAGLLDGLVRDVKALSAVVVQLDDLAADRDWDKVAEMQFQAALITLGQLCERYRTGDSILTLRARPASGTKPPK